MGFSIKILNFYYYKNIIIFLNCFSVGLHKFVHISSVTSNVWECQFHSIFISTECGWKDLNLKDDSCLINKSAINGLLWMSFNIREGEIPFPSHHPHWYFPPSFARSLNISDVLDPSKSGVLHLGPRDPPSGLWIEFRSLWTCLGKILYVYKPVTEELSFHG